MKSLSCALCGSKEHTELLYPSTIKKTDIPKSAFSGRKLPDRIHYRLLKCTNCGIIFSSPILSCETIAKLYRQSTYNVNAHLPYLAQTYLALFQIAQRLLPKNQRPHPHVLDIGCGNGYFLNFLVAKGITTYVAGIEPSTEEVARSGEKVKRKIVCDVLKRGQFLPQTFDIICSFQTLDHIIDLQSSMKEMHALLKPKGIILIVVHDTQGLSVRLFGERSPIFDIQHVYLFNKTNLAKLFEKYGFRVLKVNNINNTYPLSFWLSMSGLPKWMKQVGNKILSLTHLGLFPFSLSAGNIALIAQKP